jgi:hypothetical protein
MLRAAAVLAAGCAPAPQPEPPAPARDVLVNRVWSATDADAPRGKMRVFLDTGVLIADSCWETYRLSNWRREGDDQIVWEEDGKSISAQIVELSETALRLRLELVSETVDEAYLAAQPPFVCPDMPR